MMSNTPALGPDGSSRLVETWPSLDGIFAGLRDLELHRHEMPPEERAIADATIRSIADLIHKEEQDQRWEAVIREAAEVRREVQRREEDVKRLLQGPCSAEEQQLLDRLLAHHLHSWERKVLQLRFAQQPPLSFRKIGERLGFSQERMRQVFHRAIGKLCVAKEREVTT